MKNIRSETVGGGCILYYMDIDEAIKILSVELSKYKEIIRQDLNIDVNDLKKERDDNSKPLQSELIADDNRYVLKVITMNLFDLNYWKYSAV